MRGEERRGEEGRGGYGEGKRRIESSGTVEIRGEAAGDTGGRARKEKEEQVGKVEVSMGSGGDHPTCNDVEVD